MVFSAIQEFAVRFNGELPRPGNIEDAEKMFHIAEEINQRRMSSDEFYVRDLESFKNIIIRFAMCSRGMIAPMCALMGGVVAQEVLKAASGIVFNYVARLFQNHSIKLYR